MVIRERRERTHVRSHVCVRVRMIEGNVAPEREHGSRAHNVIANGAMVCTFTFHFTAKWSSLTSASVNTSLDKLQS